MKLRGTSPLLYAVLSTCLLASILVTGEAHAGRAKIKVATLAPEGSSWSKVMHEWARELKKKSGGKLKLKLYESGVMGDEADVIRKMQIGQVHAGVFTGNGLGMALPEIRVLETPFLFSDDAFGEVDYVWSKLGGEFRGKFEARGYVILGELAETGFVRLLSSTPLRSQEDLSKIKMWLWQGDRFAEANMKGMGIVKLSPLTVPDVLTSLQTGLIEGVYSPTYAAIAMQWHSRTKYFTKNSLTYALGGIILSKKKWDKLDPEHQALLAETARTYSVKLRDVSRSENQKAVGALKKAGLQELPLNADALAAMQAAAKKARRGMAPEFFPLELLQRVEALVAEKRGK